MTINRIQYTIIVLKKYFGISSYFDLYDDGSCSFTYLTDFIPVTLANPIRRKKEEFPNTLELFAFDQNEMKGKVNMLMKFVVLSCEEKSGDPLLIPSPKFEFKKHLFPKINKDK